VKALLLAGLVLLPIALCSCQAKPTTVELLTAYAYTLDQLANYASESSQEAEAQAESGEITSAELSLRYQEITIVWAQTIEELDKDKQYRELWPLIFNSSQPPQLVKQPTSPDLIQWTSYMEQVEEYIFIHYQLVNAAWEKLGYS
jgi:hypothetical protein